MELKEHYARGGLGDSVVKKYLLDELLAFLEPIRKKREEFAKDPQYVLDLIYQGTVATEKVAAHTMRGVRSAMGLYTP
jgi:tryptophanyl-tRNA synthetase